MSYEYIVHGPWIPLKGVGKFTCRKCGLVNLNNTFTQWAIKYGCNNEDHPDHEKQKHKASTFK